MVRLENLVVELADGSIVFYASNEVPSDKVLFGYKSQFKVCIGMGLAVAQGGNIETLVVGYPRTGKTVLPYALAHRLNTEYGQNFSLTMIDCDACGAENIKDIFRAIQLARDHLPALIAFDEFEECAPSIPDLRPGTPEVIQSRRLRRYTSERELREKTLLLCISNYPSIIEKSTIANFDAYIFFQETESEAIAEIIQSSLEVEKAADIAKSLIESREKEGLATLGFSVLRACKMLSIKKDQLKDKTPKEVADELEKWTSIGCTRPDANDYRQKYQEYISRAQKQEPWYLKQADEMIAELPLKKQPP